MQKQIYKNSLNEIISKLASPLEAKNIIDSLQELNLNNY